MSSYISRSIKLICCFAVVCALFFLLRDSNTVNAGNKNNQLKTEIESSLFVQTEFFGSQISVPLPTVQASKNLNKLLEKYPNEPQIVLQLARLNEKLENFAQAEKDLQHFTELSSNKIEALENLSSFYHQRANFKKEGETIETILQISPLENREYYFARLLELAEKNGLENYLTPVFYEKYINENSFSFNVIEKYLDKLIENKQIDKALEFIRESKSRFPEHKLYFLEKEISLLPANESEKLYIESFDPFWSEQNAQNFYNFLSDNDRLRAYGNELREKFQKDKSDFDTAIRLIGYRNHDYKYGNDSSENIILQLERERNKKQIKWNSEELLILSRILLSEDNGDLASRYLYTLFLQPDVQQKGEMRAKVLYQLFEVFVDSDSEKVTLSKGDLRFYEDIAKADSRPGISTGILSLIFSDTNIQKKFEEKQANAVRLFNLSAAYQLFQEYKTEQPTSPQLAQMYLDLIRLNVFQNELIIAQQLLNEFEQRFENSEDFTNVALKLGDAYIAIGDFEKEREIYQKILDYIGRNRKGQKYLIPISNDIEEPTSTTPTTIKYSADSNSGVNMSSDIYKKYNDFLDQNQKNITYQQILTRFVSSLSTDNKTKEILSLFANEIKKYPDEPGLYEQLLQWLGQTNLVDEQLKIYKTALKKFPNQTWQNRLSRWFIKREKMKEFSEFSNELLQNFDDKETENFLNNFINENGLSTPESFNGQLYEGLYSLAHERFPHNQNFVQGLLKFYKNNKQEEKWRELLTKYYFESQEIREEFLFDLAKQDKLRDYLFQAHKKISSQENSVSLPYKLFYADASRKLSNFEEAIDTYKLLDKTYPNTPEFIEPLINITRSLGQKDKQMLRTSAFFAKAQSDAIPVNTEYRTRSGEIQAELGNYENARNEWNKLLLIESNAPDTFLDTATVFWDYFQNQSALETIEKLRKKTGNNNIYAFQTGAIFEAQNKMDSALNEYIKALGNDVDFHRVEKRLTQLYKREDISKKLEKEFQKQKHDPHIAINYAKFLIKIEKEKGLQIVRQTVIEQNSDECISEALSIFREFGDLHGEQITLAKLAKSNKSPRTKIAYELQLAESFYKIGEKGNSAKVLDNLIKKYPTNYGVLDETSDFYWRIGAYEKAVTILRSGMNLGVGKFHYYFARKLAIRLQNQNKLIDAGQILLKLFETNKIDSEVFRELLKIYVQTNKSENLLKITNESIAEIKDQDIEPREIKYQLIERRKILIDAFARLKDYDSAIEQYIEIINSESESSENLDEAIAFVERYGGAEKLIDYYNKLAETSYKNYRWFAVLARIHKTNKNYAQAIENYRIAIHNQPEIPELYESLTQTYILAKNYNSALDTINELIKLTTSKTNYIKQKIEILIKLGRFNEAEIEAKTLPIDEQKSLKSARNEPFIEDRLQSNKSVEDFHKMFIELKTNPFKSNLKSSDIKGYVQTIHQINDLNIIFDNFWNLREKLIAELEDKNSTNAGKAKVLLETIDGSLPNSIGQISQNVATNRELSALFNNFEQKISNAKNSTDKYKTLSLLQNLIRECDFEELEEKILIAKKDEAFSYENSDIYHQNLQIIIDFYSQRGNLQRVLEILQKEKSLDKNNTDFPYDRLIAENSKLLGDTNKEIEALEKYFDQTTENLDKEYELIERFFELLINKNKQKLVQLANNNSKHRIQLINFLIKKEEASLAHKAIESSGLSEAWRLSRGAEISLLFGEFENENKQYFANALQISTIGEIIDQPPKLSQREWFRLSETFGKWLYLSNENNISDKYLTAMIEEKPEDFKEQMRLGNFYLSQKDFPKALEHFQIAYEINPSEKDIFAKLGIALFQSGETQKADIFWTKIIENDPTSKDIELYLKTLYEYGQAEKARKNLQNIIVRYLKPTTNNNSTNFEEKQIYSTDISKFVEVLSGTFRDDNAKTIYFLDLCRSIGNSKELTEILIKNSIIKKDDLSNFYEILIERSEDLRPYDNDSEFDSFVENTFETNEAEILFELRSDTDNKIPNSEKLSWQKEFLEYLLEKKNTEKAKLLIEQIERSIAKRYVRPDWLKLAKIELDILDNNTQQAMKFARNFIGIEIPKEAVKIKLPNIERLNGVLEILKINNKDTEFSELKKQFYGRKLALGVYENLSFAELANEFEQQDQKLAGKFLYLMCEIAKGERSEKFKRELAELEFIKEFAEDAEKLPNQDKLFSMDYAESLKFAAEISAKFNHLYDAKIYRATLLDIAPGDIENRIEYARLSAATDSFDEAITHLIYLIGNRNIDQSLRWRAALIASKIAQTDKNLQKDLMSKLKFLQTQDVEIWRILDILNLSKNEQDLKTDNNGFESIFWKFMRANNAAENGMYKIALEEFAMISMPERQAKLLQSFGFEHEKPISQMIRIYAQTKSPYAALNVAKNTDFSKNVRSSFSNSYFPTLEQQIQIFQARSDLEILTVLSKTAEDIKDYSLALKFERSKRSLIEKPTEIDASNERIADLEIKLKKQLETSKILYRVNKENVSAKSFLE